jgi:thiol-disulfide isomerase/thioredoxin
MKRRDLAVGAVALAAAAAGGGFAFWNNTRKAAAEEADASDAPVDLWAQRFERPEGGELVMADLKGKPLVLNFWATWCPPCVKELPQFERFSQEFAAQGWQVIGVAIDSPAPVRDFLARVKVTFPIGLAGFQGTDLSRSLGNTQGALPFTVVIDRVGNVVERKLGETSFEDMAAWAAKFGAPPAK